MRMFSNSGSASMGYDLPAAIGAYFGALAARGSSSASICLAGDGSIMMNLQELQTIAQHRLPIKIFVLDNRGYLSIRTSQANFFGRLAAPVPTIRRQAARLRRRRHRLRHPGAPSSPAPTLPPPSPQCSTAEGPQLCDVILDEPGLRAAHEFAQAADGSIVSPPLEDMFPFLDWNGWPGRWHQHA
jgi:acetolactate synthase-1/2/3 large subunit